MKFGCREKWRKYFWPLLVGIVILFGVYLRTVEYSQLLIFQSDQSRDALIVESALINGFSTLPLLGPQARGSSLHLGPAFYYFQFLSGKTFGASPESYAYPDLFFGVATLIVLLGLLRRYFSRGTVLWLLALVSTSLLLVTFSRFAWNPNSLPFFTSLFLLFFFLSLEKSEGKRFSFLLGAAFCFGIITQLHFVALLALGLAIGMYLCIYRPLSWKEIVFCVGVVLIVNTPLVINEFYTNGSNTSAFLETVEEKGDNDGGHMVHEKLFRAYQSYAEINWLFVTGKQNTEMVLTRGWELKCDKQCREVIGYSMLSLLLSGSILWANLYSWRKRKESILKKEQAFLLIWFGCYFFVSVLVAYQISTRFYLGIAPLFFLFFGFWIEEAIRILRGNKFSLYGGIFLGSLVIFANLQATQIYLVSLQQSQISHEVSNRDLVFGTDIQVTLGQLKEMAAKAEGLYLNGDPIIISGESRYVRSLYYMLRHHYQRSGCYIKGNADEKYAVGHITISRASAVPLANYQIDFGTLRAGFKEPFEVSDKDKNKSLPQGCIDY